MRADTHLVLLAVLLTATACGKPPEPPKGEPRGRAETQGLRNVDVLGQSGTPIANKLDTALDQNDARKATLDAGLEAQENPH